MKSPDWKCSVGSNQIKSLFTEYRGELHRYIASKLRNAEMAADLTQETFLRFAEQMRNNPNLVITHTRSYLYRTAHNLIVDYLRQQDRMQMDSVPTEALFDVVDEAPSPEQVTSDKNSLAVAQMALLELPERTRQIFVMVRLEGLTYSEVAQQLAISDSSVQKHLARAVKQVMQRLRHE